MAEYPKRSQFFADFKAEGTINSRVLSPMLMGKPSELGALPVAVESSFFHNGNESFISTGPETGLFVIRSLEHVIVKTVTPGKNHAILKLDDTVRAYGTFKHTSPTGYTAEDLAGGMIFDESNNSVEYPIALLSIQNYHNYDHYQPVLPVVIEKLHSLPTE
jgi:hypothetical protein